MLIAESKRKENIAEYVLYMWQLEDLIRASNFDLDQLKAIHIYPMTDDEGLRIQATQWMAKLIKEMKDGDMKRHGHVMAVKQVMLELTYLHNTLLGISNNAEYQRVYEQARPDLEEFRVRSGGKAVGDVELCFNALYLKLLMAMQKKEVSAGTASAMENFKGIVVFLAKAWHRSQQGQEGYGQN